MVLDRKTWKNTFSDLYAHCNKTALPVLPVRPSVCLSVVTDDVAITALCSTTCIAHTMSHNKYRERWRCKQYKQEPKYQSSRKAKDDRGNARRSMLRYLKQRRQRQPIGIAAASSINKEYPKIPSCNHDCWPWNSIGFLRLSTYMLVQNFVKLSC